MKLQKTLMAMAFVSSILFGGCDSKRPALEELLNGGVKTVSEGENKDYNFEVMANTRKGWHYRIATLEAKDKTSTPAFICGVSRYGRGIWNKISVSVDSDNHVCIEYYDNSWEMKIDGENWLSSREVNDPRIRTYVKEKVSQSKKRLSEVTGGGYF